MERVGRPRRRAQPLLRPKSSRKKPLGEDKTKKNLWKEKEWGLGKRGRKRRGIFRGKRCGENSPIELDRGVNEDETEGRKNKKNRKLTCQTNGSHGMTNCNRKKNTVGRGGCMGENR